MCCLVDGSGDCGGVSAGGFVCGGSRLFAGQEFIQPFGVDFVAQKIGFGQQAAEEGDVGLDAGDGGLFEGAAKACDGFFAAVSPGDELGE